VPSPHVVALCNAARRCWPLADGQGTWDVGLLPHQNRCLVVFGFPIFARLVIAHFGT